MSSMPDIFGEMVFGDREMRERLPEDIYRALRRTIDRGKHLELDIANSVAAAMRDWACEKGVTHFTHWFQPMTGITAEKHDSFLRPAPEGRAIMEFSGRELVRGEPDASSFPSGGLRATFEARGYTAWDPTSYAFIKDDTLCIPSVFISYGGEVLDKKTPLLRSMEVLSNQARRILRLFGMTDVKKVVSNVGAEQEYFLIDRELFERRRDLVYCGRTLFGAKPPKGQELEDHYFGMLKPRVRAFMRDLDEELWRLGVFARTEHNEAAPSQHELAPIYTSSNTAADHNQLTMEMMQKVAARHGLACLLHEKPFAGVNGSGKHNNWSLSTDTGINLLDPHDDPDKKRFLLFVVAVLEAVDNYADMLRITTATAGNDHRLGASEAPPAIVSVYLGDELTAILDAIDNGSEYGDRESMTLEAGASVIPHIPKDTSDRNRTSPFAFTGNKFEYRMIGSSQSISGPNILLNTAVAEALSSFADELEKADDFEAALNELIRRKIREHKRIVFNGNNYSQEWMEEAGRRGLPNYESTAEALPHYKDEKNVRLFTKHHIYTRAEIESRCEIRLDNYCKVISIEALTMLEMARQDLIPAAVTWSSELAGSVSRKRDLGIDSEAEKALCAKVTALIGRMDSQVSLLEGLAHEIHNQPSAEECARFCRNKVLPAMQSLRETGDALETIMPRKYMPWPTYGELLYSV
ncbi:MAG: glutamine synthetase III [Oscillospiraceae bacterium]|jgi:glutamine synthetase